MGNARAGTRLEGRIGLSYWLVKTEPASYSWADLVRDRRTIWDGVRNSQARHNLAAMHKGDRILFYHSGSDKAVVGVASVVAEAYPDPTARQGDWLAVDLEPVGALAEPVTLAQLKADPATSQMRMVRQGRLSVSPVTPNQYGRVLSLAKTKLA